MSSTARPFGYLLGLTAVCLFGGALPATRLALIGGLTPWFAVAARAAIAGLIAVAVLAIFRPPFPRAHIGRIALMALCVVIGFPVFMTLAVVSVPASHGGVVLGLLPLSTTIGAVFIGGERPSPAFWLLTVLGAALVAAFALRDGDIAIATGDIYLVLAVALTGIGYALAGTLARDMPGWQVAAWPLLLCLPFAIIAAIWLAPADPAAVRASGWAGLLYVSAGPQFLAYVTWSAALARSGIARIGQLQLLQPFVTFAIAVPLLGETIDLTTVAFAIAIAVVVAISRRAAVRGPAT